MKPRFHRNTSVVSADYARGLLIEHFDLYRESDSRLLLLSHTDSGWHKPAEGEKPLHVLLVDQGAYDDTWDGKSLRFSHRGEELVDFCNLLTILAGIHIPDFKPEPSPYMGGGRTTRHYITQYWTPMVEGGHIEDAPARVPELSDLLLDNVEFAFMWDPEAKGVQGYIEFEGKIRDMGVTRTLQAMINSMFEARDEYKR